MTRLIADAPAKINLTLRVLGKRSDGFHELDTVYQVIDLWDTLEFELADAITLTTDHPRLPIDSSNLVRRAADLQAPRIQHHSKGIGQLLDVDPRVEPTDVHLVDEFLAPGYGRFATPVVHAMQAAAQCEGLILDPVYTGKAMAGLIQRAEVSEGRGLLFMHTGGQPALFAYEDDLTKSLQGTERTPS